MILLNERCLGDGVLPRLSVLTCVRQWQVAADTVLPRLSPAGTRSLLGGGRTELSERVPHWLAPVQRPARPASPTALHGPGLMSRGRGRGGGWSADQDGSETGSISVGLWYRLVAPIGPETGWNRLFLAGSDGSEPTTVPRGPGGRGSDRRGGSWQWQHGPAPPRPAPSCRRPLPGYRFLFCWKCMRELFTPSHTSMYVVACLVFRLWVAFVIRYVSR